MADLAKEGCPEKSDFFSSLKNKSVSDSEYDSVRNTWNEKQINTLLDFVKMVF